MQPGRPPGPLGRGLFDLLWRHIDLVSRTRRVVDRILEARDVPEQMDIYRAELRDRLLGEGLMSVVGSPGVLSLLGVTEPQRLMVHEGRGGFAGFVRRAIASARNARPARRG